MIENFECRRHRAADVAKISNPAIVRVDRTREVHRNLKRVPVQAGAFVVGWNVGQPVGRLERELLEDLHAKTLMSAGSTQDGLITVGPIWFRVNNNDSRI
jgi:hypothetical protein